MIEEELKKIDILPAEEQIEILKQIRNGDDSRKGELITTSIGLVYSVAKNYAHALSPNWEFSDIVNEGIIGLMKAIEKYDIAKAGEINFSTYAVYWIKQTIIRFIGNSNSTIRIPIHVYEKYRKMNQYIVSGETLREARKKAEISEEEAEEIELTKNLVSLDKPIAAEDGHCDSPLSDFLRSKENVEEDVVDKLMIEKLFQLLDDKLSVREKYIAIKRWGLDGDPQTLETIGQTLGISRERVRQVETSIAKKLKKQIAKECEIE